jgi:osmotically-inducible protein OsmY
MKRFSRFFSVLILAMSLITVVGCASTPRQQGTGEYVDDGVITTKVKAMLFDEPNLRSGQINVETFKGVVQLSGFVSTRADIDRAVEIARSVKGVESVKNDMRLR